MAIPTVYRDGYHRMAVTDPDWARRYVEHLTVGDPLADAAIDSLAPLSETLRQDFIRAGMERNEQALSLAPQALTDFFGAVAAVPSWFDSGRLAPGYRGFHANSAVLSLVFIVGSGIEGFGSLIAKAFFATGRMVDFGVRRARQNTWHLAEIMTPGGLGVGADGWRLTLRIRLVHAQVRRQLREWDGWDEAAEGMPISMAHLGLASAIFSARCLEFGHKLGVRLKREEHDAIMTIWRYTAFLLGVPDALLFRDSGDALELCRVGLGCEPEFGIEQIAMANALINSIPMLGGFTEPGPRRKYATKLYRVSRALIGDDLADRFRFPRQNTMGLLPALALWRRLNRSLASLKSWYSGEPAMSHYMQLLDLVRPEEIGMSYRLPPQLHSDERIEW